MLQKIAFISEHFELGSPAQQLLDRFLIGFSREGVFQASNATVIAWDSGRSSDFLARRVSDFNLQLVRSIPEAVAGADAVLVVQTEFPGIGTLEEKSFVADFVNNGREGTPIFVYGLLAPNRSTSEGIAGLAKKRGIPLCAGTVGSVLLQLPPLNIPKRSRISKALILAPSSAPDVMVIDALLAVLEEAGADFAQTCSVGAIVPAQLWNAPEMWPSRLLGPALSRSDRILGNTLLDGRTEDITSSAPELAKNLRELEIGSAQGWRASALFSEGALGDIVLAIETNDRKIHSTQLFQAPPPQQEHFSRLADTINAFFRTKEQPWSDRKTILTSFALQPQ